MSQILVFLSLIYCLLTLRRYCTQWIIQYVAISAALRQAFSLLLKHWIIHPGIPLIERFDRKKV